MYQSFSSFVAVPPIGVNFKFNTDSNKSDQQLPPTACLVLRLFLKTGPDTRSVTLDKKYINMAGWNLNQPSRGEVRLSKDNIHLLHRYFRTHLSVWYP